MISFISSIEIINFFIPDPKMFLWIAASVTNAAAINPNDIKMLLANSLSTFPIKDKLLSKNGLRSLPTNPAICTILGNWVFDNFMLAYEPSAKAL